MYIKNCNNFINLRIYKKCDGEVIPFLYNYTRMMKILIVEDNVITALDLKLTIAKFGFKVTDIVADEIGVLASIEENKPDAIIMDISLNGGKDGIEIVKVIYDICYIPIIYLTENEDDEIIERAIETEPIAYLVNPFCRIELKYNLMLAFYQDRQKNNQKKQYKDLGFNYSFDAENLHLYYKNKIQKLSSKESQFLDLLIRANGEVVLLKTIEIEIWENKSVTDDAIRLLVSRLRKKLKYPLIETVRYYGFKFYKKS